MENIKNVIFDLGGVLVDLDIERCRRAFIKLGMEKVAQIIDPCYPAAMIGQFECGAIDEQQMCDIMREVAGTPKITNEQIEWAYGEFLIDTPVEKLRMLQDLRRRGVRTFVLSNNNPMSMRKIRRMFTADGLNFEDYFDKVYTSYQMKVLKPSEEIFHRLVADSGICPEETLFIDDGLKNIETAQRLGFGVFFATQGEDYSHLFSEMGEVRE